MRSGGFSVADLDIGGGFGLGGDGAGNFAAAMLFIQASTNTLDVASALNSSPWTAQSFGSDPEKAKACMHYVYQSMGLSAFYCFSAAFIARSWWPIFGYSIAAGYMFYLYTDALNKAQKTGSTSWDSKSSAGSAAAPTTRGYPRGVDYNRIVG
jgi:hypothetical protein